MITVNSLRPGLSVALAASLLAAGAVSCSSFNTSTIYGNRWPGLIRTPLAPNGQTPGSPPYTIRETLRVSGGFGEVAGDLSKYNFEIVSPTLRVTNDKPRAGETLNDVWYKYSDTGALADGSREVTVTGRCFLESKRLHPLHPVGRLDYVLRMVVVPGKPFHFVMNIDTTSEGTSSDLQISSNASAPSGAIAFFPP